MKIIFGFFIVVMNLFLFCFTLVGAMNQLKDIKPIQSTLEKKINLKDIHLPQNSYIYDQNRNLISEIYGAVNRLYLEYEDIPQNVLHAFIATEDQHFFEHKGFDVTGIARAVLANAQADSIEQGGSTISQQLVRNLYLDNAKSYNRKLTELLYAYQLEMEWSKEEILELYVNAIYFGNGTYGIEAASLYYFSKPVNELTLAELTILCSIPNNPSYYDPIQRFENTKNRQKWILDKMAEAKFIEKKEADQALLEKVMLNPSEKVDLFPNYVAYVHNEFTKLIAKKEGYEDQLGTATGNEKILLERKLEARVNDLFKKGIIIHTALNKRAQKNIVKTLNQRLPEKDIEGAVAVIDHRLHEIVAIVGGKDYKKFDFHRAYQAYRQPGSSIKPLLVYAPYLEEYNLSIWNTVNAGPFCKAGYCPSNYGGGIYGTVPIETALKYSYNTAAVRILYETGVENAFRYLNRFDFSMVTEEDKRLPAAIGGFAYGMTPLEMTNAYTTFSNDGNFQPARAIRKVTDLNGNVLYQWNDEKQMVWSSNTNNKMRNLLNKVVTSGTGNKAYLSSNYIGGKTGTTNDFKDLWFIGLTDKYTTGVWVGKDNPESMERISHRSPHLLIWRDVMNDLMNNE